MSEEKKYIPLDRADIPPWDMIEYVTISNPILDEFIRVEAEWTKTKLSFWRGITDGDTK